MSGWNTAAALPGLTKKKSGPGIRWARSPTTAKLQLLGLAHHTAGVSTAIEERVFGVF